jgi:hypothetical protein
MNCWRNQQGPAAAQSMNRLAGVEISKHERITSCRSRHRGANDTLPVYILLVREAAGNRSLMKSPAIRLSGSPLMAPMDVQARLMTSSLKTTACCAVI